MVGWLEGHLSHKNLVPVISNGSVSEHGGEGPKEELAGQVSPGKYDR